MNRRLALLALFALTACTATGDTASPLATDAALIDTGLSIVVPVVLASKGITPSEINAVNSAMMAVHAATTALASGGSMTSQQAIIAGVQAVAEVAGRYLPAGSQEALAVVAATRLAVLFLPPGTVGAGSAPGMTVEQARVVLQGMRR